VTALQEGNSEARKHLEQGRHFFGRRHWTETIFACRQALQLDPGLVEGRLLLARAALRIEDYDLARSHLQAALKQAPQTPAVYQLLGELFWREGANDQAIRYLRQAMAATEKTPDRLERSLTHLYLAMALHNEGYLTAAADEFEAFLSAVAAGPERTGGCPELDQARDQYRDQALVSIGQIQSALGNHEQALAAFQRAWAANPRNCSARAGMILALAQAGRAKEALAAAELMFTELPEAPESRAALQQVCVLLGQPEQYAVELVGIARRTEESTLRLRAAEALLDQGKASQAIEVLQTIPPGQAPSVQAACLLADAYLRQGRLPQAVHILLELLGTLPASYLRVEGVLQDINDPALGRQLAEVLSEMIVRHPEDAALRYLRGRLLSLQGPPPQGEEELEEEARLDKSFGPAHAALADLHARQRDWPRVIQEVDAAIEADLGNPTIYLIKGQAADALDLVADAEGAWQTAFERDRQSPQGLYLLAGSLERRGQRDRCERLYRQIVEQVAPRFVPARERLFLLYLNSDRLQEALECFSAFEDLQITGPVVERCRAMLNLATVQADNPQRFTTYQEELRRIGARYPDDVDAALALAISYLAAGDYPEALAYAEQALRIAPQNLRGREFKADLLARLLRFWEATSVVQDLLKDRPRDPGYLQKLLELALIQADYDTAVTVLRELLARDDLGDRRPVLTAQLIESLIAAERLEGAIQTAKQWLQEAPADPARRSAYLSALAKAGRHPQAVETIRRYLAEDPTNGPLRAQYIGLLQAAGRNVEAQQEVLAWLANDPDDLNLNRLLISLFWSAKDWESAIEVARTGAELSENRGAYENLLGQSYVLAGRYDLAIQFYRDRAGTFQTESAYRDLIAVLIRAERLADAEQVVDRLLLPELARRDGGHPYDVALVVTLRRYLASIYEAMDRPDQAAWQLEEIYKLAPGDPGINNDLGYTWADAGLHLTEAEQMIRLAVTERPTESAYLDSLGWVLYKRGRFDDAVYYLDLAIRKAESPDCIMFDHLGDALYRAGQVDQAWSWWEKALNLADPEKQLSLSARDRRLGGRIQAKLRQLAEGREPELAPLAEPASSTQPAEQAAAAAATQPEERVPSSGAGPASSRPRDAGGG
jgi:tetratricopeptide (TPR) repeat protein